MHTTRTIALLLVASAAACGPRIQPVRPIMDNGEILPSRTDERVATARHEGELERARLQDELAVLHSYALATCAGQICDAVARGELALGMNEAQVFAVTRTTAGAWEIRGDERAMTLSTRAAAGGPRDALGELVFVGLHDGRVRSYTYREPQGFRTVSTAFDATPAGRAAAQSDALLREGDDYAAAGDLSRALERYDRADIIRPNHAETMLRIATTLDKSLRPIEAILRYQMFIHQMELERIHARGEAAARIAEAITRAQQRIIILERHR